MEAVHRVSSFIEATTAGRWRLASILRANGVVVLEASTPEGIRHIELTAVEPGASSYRIIGDVSVSYRQTSSPASRDFLRVLDRLLTMGEPLLSHLLHHAGDAEEASATKQTQGAAPAPVASLDLPAHVYALQASGFTIARAVVDRDQIAKVGDIADRALAETYRQLAQGAPTPDGMLQRDFQMMVRGLYLWGDACLRVLESEAIREVSEAVIGPHKLIDVALIVSHPAAGRDPIVSEAWHRDVEPVLSSPYRASYLWFMIPIDDFRSDNGSTWVVPGSHRLADPGPLNTGGSVNRYPSRAQMLLDAGDALVLDPSTVHSRGHNGTDRPRRVLNVTVCHRDAPLRWQWDFAGQEIRAKASPRVRELLGGSLSAQERAAFAADLHSETKLQRTHEFRSAAWPTLPPGWIE